MPGLFAIALSQPRQMIKFQWNEHRKPVRDTPPPKKPDKDYDCVMMSIHASPFSADETASHAAEK